MPEPTPQAWWSCCPFDEELGSATLNHEAGWIECHYPLRPVGSLLLVRFEACPALSPTAVPAMDWWGAVVLSVALVAAAVFRLRRSTRPSPAR